MSATTFKKMYKQCFLTLIFVQVDLPDASKLMYAYGRFCRAEVSQHSKTIANKCFTNRIFYKTLDFGCETLHMSFNESCRNIAIVMIDQCFYQYL